MRIPRVDVSAVVQERGVVLAVACACGDGQAGDVRPYLGEVVYDETCAGACCRVDDARVCCCWDAVFVGVVVDYAGDSGGVDGAEGALQRVVVDEDP